MIVPNLLLVAGKGTKSGKTSMICRIIELLPELDIAAIKITPHFHETTQGLILLAEGDGYAIYEETSRDESKDTSRMLNSGAHKVYFAKVWDNKLFDVFERIMEYIPENVPVICESPALRNFIDPGIFVIMTSDMINKQKNISHLQGLPHVSFKLEKLPQLNTLPFGFADGRWFLKTEDRSTSWRTKSEE